jgi:hypothetical protein
VECGEGAGGGGRTRARPPCAAFEASERAISLDENSRRPSERANNAKPEMPGKLPVAVLPLGRVFSRSAVISMTVSSSSHISSSSLSSAATAARREQLALQFDNSTIAPS